MLFFCYGTLKKDGCRQHYLKDQEFLGPKATSANYILYNLGGFPGLRRVEENGKSIKGELYKIDDKCRQAMDYMEGHPDLFRRDLIELEDGTEVMAYLWQGRAGKDNGDCWVN